MTRIKGNPSQSRSRHVFHGINLSLIILCAALFSQSPAQTYVEQHGQLKVTGNKIVDKNGNAVTLRGMSLYWSQWMGQYYTAGCVKWLRDDWKCNVVRAAMAVGSQGYLTNPTTEKNKIKTVVQACIDNGIYVIIDWHALDGNASYTSQAQTFFAEMAQTYGQYPNVLYELWNEPTTDTWASVIKPYHEAVITKIREKDPDNIIICGTKTWSQDVDEASKTPLTSSTNIAYTLHFYATTHKQSLRDKAQTALNNGAAIFVTEYGTCESSGNGTFDTTETRKWFSFMNTNAIGHCNWSISTASETSAALKSGASGNGNWTDANLTASGKWIRAYLIAQSTTGLMSSAGRDVMPENILTMKPQGHGMLFSLSGGMGALNVYDLSGSCMTRLDLKEGMTVWNGTGNSGCKLANGAYVVRFINKNGRSAGDQVYIQR